MPRQGIMLAVPFEEKRLEKWKPPYIVQPKLDGERCRAVCGGTNQDDYIWFLTSSENNMINSVPHIEEALAKQIKEPIELDGELYIHGTPFEEIHSIVGRTVNQSIRFADMEYHIFDIIDSNTQYKRALDLLKLTFYPPLIRVPNSICETLDDIMRAYDEFINLGYEGIIVRHFAAPYQRKRATTMMKFKPKKSDIYKIVDYKEEVSIEGVPKGSLGSLICLGQDGESTFSVGSGFSRYLRNNLWGGRFDLKGRYIKVSYQHITTKNKVPRFPIFVEFEDYNYG